MDDITKRPPPAENTAEIQRGRPFEPGQSGNPAGRPKGRRNNNTLFLEALVDGESEAIVRNVVDGAKQGKSTELRLIFPRLVPPRERPIEMVLPPIDTLDDLKNASTAVVEACFRAEISPREATKLMSVLGAHGANLALSDMRHRLATLEKKMESLDEKAVATRP